MTDAMKEAHDHHRVTPAGRALGERMVRLTEPTIRSLECEGEPDERCKSCAFRAGTVPNGCPQTQLDVLKAVVEGVPFLCHQADKKRWPCHGWYAARVALRRAQQVRGTALSVTTCPWEFSPPDEAASGVPERLIPDPLCPCCHGQGRYVSGYSGRDDDGNAALWEDCDCFMPANAPGVKGGTDAQG